MLASDAKMSGALQGRLRQAIAGVLLLALLLALGYLGWKASSPTPAATVENLRIALSTVPQSSLFPIAAAKGYFAAEGLAVTLIPVSHGKVAIERVLAGEAELALAAEVPFVIAVMKGEALSVAANLLDIGDGHALIARRDRGITAPADLVGKKVGVSFGSSGEYFLWAYCIRYKLAPDSLILVDLLPAQLAPALASGTIDAVATWTPFVVDAQLALGDQAVTLTDPEVYSQSVMIVGGTAFLTGHRDAIKKLLRALLKAERLTREHPEESLAIVAPWLQRDPKLLRLLWKTLDFKVELAQSSLVTLEAEARWAMARGYVARGPVPNFLPNVYLDALLAVSRGRVTVVH